MVKFRRILPDFQYDALCVGLLLGVGHAMWVAITTALLVSVLWAFLSLADDVSAQAEVAGVIRAEVDYVYDGDTMRVMAEPWPDVFVNVLVRVRGIDTPELRGGCPDEQLRAREARDFTAELVEVAGGVVELTRVGDDKYYGRVVADVSAGGRSVAEELLASGMARPYGGGTREGWCD